MNRRLFNFFVFFTVISEALNYDTVFKLLSNFLKTFRLTSSRVLRVSEACQYSTGYAKDGGHPPLFSQIRTCSIARLRLLAQV